MVRLGYLLNRVDLKKMPVLAETSLEEQVYINPSQGSVVEIEPLLRAGPYKARRVNPVDFPVEDESIVIKGHLGPGVRLALGLLHLPPEHFLLHLVVRPTIPNVEVPHLLHLRTWGQRHRRELR